MYLLLLICPEHRLRGGKEESEHRTNTHKAAGDLSLSSDISKYHSLSDYYSG